MKEICFFVKMHIRIVSLWYKGSFFSHCDIMDDYNSNCYKNGQHSIKLLYILVPLTISAMILKCMLILLE